MNNHAFTKLWCISDVGFVMSVGVWPLAEIACTLIRHYYPDAGVTVAFDFKEHCNKARQSFLENIGVSIVEHEFGKGHRGQLQKLISSSKTDVTVIIDDDAFVSSGALEDLLTALVGNDMAGIVNEKVIADNGLEYKPRILPYLFAFETRVYNDNGLDFCFPHGRINNVYHDCGASVLASARDFGLRIGVMEKMPNLEHGRRGTYLILAHDKINLSCLADPNHLDNVPKHLPCIDDFGDWRDKRHHFRAPGYQKILAALDRVRKLAVQAR